jgi:HAE1 family hydrophobic/amphiphilic exporter-1
MSHRVVVIGVFITLFAGALFLLSLIGSEFLPPADEGEVVVTIEMEEGTRLAVLDEKVRQVEALAMPAVPEAVASIVRVGGTSFRGTGQSTADIRLSLLPIRQRDRSSEQIATDLRQTLTGIPGLRIRTQAGGGLFVLRLASPTEERLTLDVRGYDFQQLDGTARAVYDAIADVPGIADLRLSREGAMPLELLRIDRVRASDLGLSVARIARTIETAIAGSTAGEFRDGGLEYRIYMRLKDAEQLGFDEILNFGLLNDRGEYIALRNVVHIERADGPQIIERQDQQRVSRIQANISGRDLGSVVGDVRDRLKTIAVPHDVEVVFAGDYEQQEKAFRELAWGIFLAVVLVYMVMACLYESLRDPVIVMFSVPMALIGVVIMLLATGTTLNAQSYIGAIMLVGIVVNNAILIVDQAGRLHRGQGWRPYNAAVEAGCRRLRPILMTSLTTMMALMPLALGIGEGSEQQAPMARTVLGGLMSSAFITLIFIPVLYSLFYGRGDTSEPSGPAEEIIL